MICSIRTDRNPAGSDLAGMRGRYICQEGRIPPASNTLLDLYLHPDEHRALKAAGVQSDTHLRELVRKAALLYVGEGLTPGQVARIRALPDGPTDRA